MPLKRIKMQMNGLEYDNNIKNNSSDNWLTVKNTSGKPAFYNLVGAIVKVVL